MKAYKRIISIFLTSAVLLGVLVCCAGCGKKSGGAGGSGEPSAVPTYDPFAGAQQPSSSTGAFYRPYFPENWGMDPGMVVLTVSIAGIEHSYTASDVYELGHSIIRVNNPNNPNSIYLAYSGMRLGAVLDDLGVEPGDLDAASLVLKDADGTPIALSGNLSALDLNKCFLGMMMHGVLVKGFKRMVFLPIVDKDTEIENIYNGVARIEIARAGASD